MERRLFDHKARNCLNGFKIPLIFSNLFDRKGNIGYKELKMNNLPDKSCCFPMESPVLTWINM
jgi:hypothetical protein